jgi:hypothetical protein
LILSFSFVIFCSKSLLSSILQGDSLAGALQLGNTDPVTVCPVRAMSAILQPISASSAKQLSTEASARQI